MIEIELFGPTRVSCNGSTLHARNLGGSKPRQVLEILAIELGCPVTKESLAERLWEDHPPRSYIATLESYVCCLRRRLADLGAEPPVLLTTAGGYLLDATHVQVDLVEARKQFDGSDPTHLETTLDLRVDVLLADDPFAAWANDIREQLSTQRVQAYVGAAHAANATGDNALAVLFARAACLERSWSEPAVQELMEALARSGNHAQALMEYQDLRTAMCNELGVEPSPATQSLYMSILCDEEPEPSYDVSVLLSLLKSALQAATGRGGAASPDMAEVGRMLLARA